MTTIGSLLPAFRLSVEDIDRTLNDLPESLSPLLIVLNDDDLTTAPYLRQLEESGRIRLLQIPFQVGKSEALRRGLTLLLQSPDVDIVAQCDGRSKQPVWQIPVLLQALHATKSDMVVGDRYTTQMMYGQLHRKASSGFMSLITRSITGYALPDTVCGTRVYRRELANYFLGLRCFGYSAEIEQLLIASLHGCSVSSAPVKSNLQANVTNAEKIEDSFYAIANYADDLDMPDVIRCTINSILVQIKRRTSFNVDLSVFGGNGQVRLTYVGENDSIVDAYTDQHIRDGYMALRLE